MNDVGFDEGFYCAVLRKGLFLMSTNIFRLSIISLCSAMNEEYFQLIMFT